MTQEPERPEIDPYAQLNELHKLIEELRADRSQLEGKITELTATIAQHHKEVFK